jgi:hypothetical protein
VAQEIIGAPCTYVTNTNPIDSTLKHINLFKNTGRYIKRAKTTH